MKDIKDIKKSDVVQTREELFQKAATKVEVILNTLFPDHVSFGNYSYTITRGSSVVMIVIRPFNNEEVCVECVSNVVYEARITPELMRFLLRKNAELYFGAFGLLFDDTITFSYSFPAENLDPNELETAVNAVAIVADYYDDKIVAIAGGKRAADVSDLSILGA